jgi:hypothetical protein
MLLVVSVAFDGVFTSATVSFGGSVAGGREAFGTTSSDTRFVATGGVFTSATVSFGDSVAGGPEAFRTTSSDTRLVVTGGAFKVDLSGTGAIFATSLLAERVDERAANFETS